MTIQLRLILIISSFLFFFCILYYIRRSKLNTDYAVIWLLWGIGVILISVFPEIVSAAALMLGVYAPYNALYLIMIFLLYVFLFILYLRFSRTEDKLTALIHETTRLKKELDELKKEDRK